MRAGQVNNSVDSALAYDEAASSLFAKRPLRFSESPAGRVAPRGTGRSLPVRCHDTWCRTAGRPDFGTPGLSPEQTLGNYRH